MFVCVRMHVNARVNVCVCVVCVGLTVTRSASPLRCLPFRRCVITKQLSLVQEEEEGASSGEVPTRPRAQAYATCAAISAWPPPNDAIARARARDTPHTRARAGNASASPCGDAMTAAAGVSFCLHGAFHQAQMTSYD